MREEQGGLLEEVARLRQEHQERVAKIRETDYEIEPSPQTQELLDTQQEFRDRVMRNLKKALYG